MKKHLILSLLIITAIFAAEPAWAQKNDVNKAANRAEEAASQISDLCSDDPADAEAIAEQIEALKKAEAEAKEAFGEVRRQSDRSSREIREAREHYARAQAALQDAMNTASGIAKSRAIARYCDEEAKKLEERDLCGGQAETARNVLRALKEKAREAALEHPCDSNEVADAVHDYVNEMLEDETVTDCFKDWLKQFVATGQDGRRRYIPAGLLISAVGTGETTGPIALLTLTNPTLQPIRFSPGAVFIPSKNAKQPYIVPPAPPVIVPSGSTIEVPINGYCAAVQLPPVGSGQPMPPVEDWVTAQPLPSGWTPNPQDGWTPSATATALNPATGQPLGHTLDFGQHPEAAADLLLTAIEQIGHAYDDLQGQGSISTPFSGRLEQEREAVVQQTFWIFAAAVQGEDYGQEDFEGKAIEQFEHSTGQNFNAAPAPVQASVKDGIMDFWNTFQAVGAQAKVLPPKAADITENWGPVVERKYEQYAVHRQTGHSHDSAMRRVFPNETAREQYSDAFRRRYGK